MFKPNYENKISDIPYIKKEFDKKLSKCTLCPRNCKVNRLKGETGFCKVAYKPFVASFGPHFGEEKCLVGQFGSGTIFYSSCNLKCIFCQNYDISILNQGQEISFEDLAKISLYLQDLNCHNINLVTPSHQAHTIPYLIWEGFFQGLKLPIVYNTSGYDGLNTLKLLDGLINIYMPDFKTLNEDFAKKYLNAPDYPEVIKKTIKEMHRQVGDLKLDENGIAYEGLLVRHLVMPNFIEDSFKILEFLAKEVSPNTAVNIMGQYFPYYLAKKDNKINRRPTIYEIEKVKEYAYKLGLRVIE